VGVERLPFAPVRLHDRRLKKLNPPVRLQRETFDFLTLEPHRRKSVESLKSLFCFLRGEIPFGE
jgi:hypothetical protein